MEEQSVNHINTDSNNGEKVMDKVAAAFESVNEGGQSELNNDAQEELQPNSIDKQESDKLDSIKHSLGKFKNVDELHKAYKSLEAEFTKRSQKLAEYENARENKRQNDISWERQVDNFVTENPLAKKYANEICGQIMADKELANNKNCLEIAYLKVLEKSIKPYEQIACDDEFLDKYILSNESIRNRIISEYLSDVARSHPYNLISDGGNFSPNMPNKPKNLKDCGEMVEKMFN